MGAAIERLGYLASLHRNVYVILTGKGFELIFETMDDVIVDVHDADVMVSKFIARAVADEILPPSFLSDPVVQVNVVGYCCCLLLPNALHLAYTHPSLALNAVSRRGCYIQCTSLACVSKVR